MIADSASTPYYAVIFTAIQSQMRDGYEKMAERMVELAESQKGFIGYESAKSDIEITISYWKDLESIQNWKNNSEHQIAQDKGKKMWYANFKVRICKIEREYDFNAV